MKTKTITNVAAAAVVAGLALAATINIVATVAASAAAPSGTPEPILTARAVSIPGPDTSELVPVEEAPAPVPVEEAPAYPSCNGWQPTPADRVEDTLGGLEPFVLIDSGPRPGANGETRLDGNGDPAAYVVAPGDSLAAIADRFCLGNNPEVIEWLNMVRWDTSYATGGEHPMQPQPGDVVNLNPRTIATVGQGGPEVRNHEPFFPIPKQW